MSDQDAQLPENIQHFVDELTEQFNRGQPDNMFRVKYDEYVKNGKSFKEYNITQDKHKCATISINNSPDNILILSVNKCTTSGLVGSGKHVLKCLINFAKKEGLPLVIEYDVSVITVGKTADNKGKTFSLAGLQMLSSGNSWYNSMGFYEKEYEHNKQFTDKFISQDVNTPTADYKKYVYEPMLARMTPKSPSPKSPSPKSPSPKTKTVKHRDGTITTTIIKSKGTGKSVKIKKPIKFTIQKTFKYIFDQLKDTANPPNIELLEYYAKFVDTYKTKLFKFNSDPEKRLNGKTYDLTFRE